MRSLRSHSEMSDLSALSSTLVFMSSLVYDDAICFD
jgi:hypothetical protein